MLLTTVRTEDAPEALLGEVRALLDSAFGDFTADDWANALGGWHVVAAEGDDVLAHASVVPRVLEVGGRRLAAGYVEAVATAPSRQGTGVGSAVMAEIASLVRARFEIGALSTGRHAFYERQGWERWRGPTSVRSGDRLLRTEEDDGGVLVLRFGPSASVDLRAPIACDHRPGDVW